MPCLLTKICRKANELVKLNQIAIQQMKVLHDVENRKLLKGGNR